MTSYLYHGTVMHARRTPRRNVFKYRICFYLIDLADLPSLNRRLRLFGHNRRRALALRDSDHFGAPLADRVRELVASRGVEVPGGRILLLTNLRVFGYVFEFRSVVAPLYGR